MDKIKVILLIALFSFMGPFSVRPVYADTINLNASGTCSIQGEVWYDINADGSRDYTEPGLENWPVFLNNGQVALTDACGRYGFFSLAPGQYAITQEPPGGWLQTFPVDLNTPSHEYTWTSSFDSAPDGTSECIATTIDPNGCILCVGTYSGTVDFDPGQGVDERTDQGQGDVFVTKLNPDGSVQWTRTFNNASPDYIKEKDIATDTSGNVYIVGTFRWITDFDPAGQGDCHKARGLSDLFLTMLHSDGSYGWTITLGGQTDNSQVIGKSVCVDYQGNVYLTGYFSYGSVDFDPGDNMDIHENYRIDNTAMFVTRLNADTTYGWTATMQGTSLPGSAFPYAIKVDLNGYLYITGKYRMTVDFDPGPSRDNHQYKGDPDIFVTKLGCDGSYAWTRSMGGSETDIGYDLCVDSDGHIYITGGFGGSATFDPHDETGYHQTIHPKMGTCFVTKLYNDGSFGWTRSWGNDYVRTCGTGIGVDALGNVYVIGEQVPDVPIDQSPRADVFLWTLNPDGSDQGMEWKTSVIERYPPIDTVPTYSWYPWQWDIAVDPTHNVVFTGRSNNVTNGPHHAFVQNLERKNDGYILSLTDGECVADILFGHTFIDDEPEPDVNDTTGDVNDPNVESTVD